MIVNFSTSQEVEDVKGAHFHVAISGTEFKIEAKNAAAQKIMQEHCARAIQMNFQGLEWIPFGINLADLAQGKANTPMGQPLTDLRPIRKQGE